jgi:hypothetical protein
LSKINAMKYIVLNTPQQAFSWLYLYWIIWIMDSADRVSDSIFPDTEYFYPNSPLLNKLPSDN